MQIKVSFLLAIIIIQTFNTGIKWLSNIHMASNLVTFLAQEGDFKFD
jgi:hypothetical protein